MLVPHFVASTLMDVDQKSVSVVAKSQYLRRTQSLGVLSLQAPLGELDESTPAPVTPSPIIEPTSSPVSPTPSPVDG